MTEQQKFILALKHLNLYNEGEYKYKVVCPFHNDLNASMLVDIPSSRFFCFGCNVHGSTYELLKNAHPNESLTAIYNYIYNNIDYNSSIGKEIKSKTKKKNINKSRDYYFNLPATNWYKLKDEDDLLVKQYLKRRGFKMHTLVNIGAKITYNSSYPVVFPMYDNNLFRGYVCRTTDPEIEQKRKYLYNEGFSRATTLVGTYNYSTVVLVEGFMDMLKAKQIGIQNVSAILGWKASQKQIEKLKKKGVKKIICALDNDECGRKGYKYLKDLKQFEVVRLHYPSSCKDMGDVTKETASKILNQIKSHGGL